MGETEGGPDETGLDGSEATADVASPQMPDTQSYQSPEGDDSSVAGGSSGGGVESSSAPSQTEAAKQAGQNITSPPSKPGGQESIEEEIEAARGMVEAAADEVNIIGGATGSK